MQDLKFVVIPALLRIALKDFVMKLDKYSSLVQQGTRRAVVEGWVNQSVVYDGRQEVILFSVFLILKDFCRFLTYFSQLYLLHWEFRTQRRFVGHPGWRWWRKHVVKSTPNGSSIGFAWCRCWRGCCCTCIATIYECEVGWTRTNKKKMVFFIRSHWTAHGKHGSMHCTRLSTTTHHRFSLSVLCVLCFLHVFSACTLYSLLSALCSLLSALYSLLSAL